jgi:hypothetical protein
MAIQETLEDLLKRLQDPLDLVRLNVWCDDVEVLWNGNQPAEDKGETKINRDDDDDDDQFHTDRLLRQVSTQLRLLFLKSLGGGFFSTEEKGWQGKSSEQHVSEILANEPEMATTSLDDTIQKPDIRVTLRASKNFLRWYLQIYKSSVVKKRSSSSKASTDPIPEWKSLQMLQLYLSLLRRLGKSDRVLAQHVAQVLFYASYNPIPGSDADLEAVYDLLMQEDGLLPGLLDCMIHSTITALTLSLIRNLHNILVTFPNGGEYAVQATVNVDEKELSTLAPWAVELRGPVTFLAALQHIALWALEADPAFPGQVDDKRAELVVEILRACYVMRLGSNLQAEGPLAVMILSLLRLDPSDPRCRDCRRACVSLLMDSSGDMAAYMLSQGALTPLHSVWEDQVTEVLHTKMVNEGAAAVLTPILVVLHKYCSASTEMRRLTKLFLFPPEVEAIFQAKYRLELGQHGTPRNMSPLLMEKGSLRWKMVQLLTWPQSHVKRFAGELLWVLCDGSSQEFIARFGMGNAVPILGAKGIIPLPM